MERGSVKRIVFIFSFFFCYLYAFAQDEQDKDSDWIHIIDDTCIYDNNNHSAFTSLAEWNGRYYVAFREAGSHVATTTDKGQIRILRKDNNLWKTNHIFYKEGWDLRDPCLVRWNNRLLLYTSFHYAELLDTGWSELKRIRYDAPHQIYIWKIRPYQNELYGIGHSHGKWPLLMKSNDGINWTVIDEYLLGGNATEADLLFVNNKLYICFRVETPDGAHSMWGESKYPFTNTSWSEMSISVHSPELHKASNSIILLSGRECLFDKETRKVDRMVSVFKINKKGLVINRKVINYEKDDQGYCSICKIGKNRYIMSYYSGSDKTVIRLVTFSIN